MNEKPILTKIFHRSTGLKGEHTVAVWNSKKSPGKFSFSCSYRGGMLGDCGERYERDTLYNFGQFDTAEEALEAGRKIVFHDEYEW